MSEFIAFEKAGNDGTAERAKPSELVGKLLVVRVLERNEQWKTKFSPEGKPAIRVNVINVDDNEVYRDVVWLNMGIVDPLTPFVGGGPVVARLVEKTSKNGSRYLTLNSPTATDLELAEDYKQQNPHLFPNG